MATDNRMKEITGNLKRDVKELLGESVCLVTGFFKRGACTVRAVADKWKAFAQDISGAVDTLMRPPFVDNGPEAPLPAIDPAAQPTVTFTSGMEGVIAENQQMTLSEANELVKNLDGQFRDEGRTPAPVKVKIDYVLDGQPDRYWLPLEIGAGGSLLEQMNRRLADFRADPDKVEQLFDQVDPEFKDEFKTAFLPSLRDNVNHLYDRVAVFFERHCEIAALEQQMTKYANTLPESAQQRFLEFTQATVANLRGKANADLRRDEPAGRVQVAAQERPRETQAPGRSPERRESVKLRLQQHKENAAQRTTERGRQPQRTVKRSRSAGHRR